MKLYHSGWLDAFRHAPAGIVLLGRFFSVRDLIAYWLAIPVGALVAQRLIGGARGARALGEADYDSARLASR